MLRHPAWAVGGYSSGPRTTETVGTKSTGGFFLPERSPCILVFKSNLSEGIPKGGADLGERLSVAVRGNLPLESVVGGRDGRTRLRRAPLPLVRLGMNDN